MAFLYRYTSSKEPVAEEMEQCAFAQMIPCAFCDYAAICLSAAAASVAAEMLVEQPWMGGANLKGRTRDLNNAARIRAEVKK